MALLARLFSPRKSYKKENQTNTPSNNPPNECRSFGYSVDKNGIRVLLFRECDWRGRKLLFDSTSVEKVPLDPKVPLSRPRNNSSDMVVEVSNGYGYKYKKPHADTNTLGEMIFGSIAMVTRGPSIKVHLMKDPPRLMFTKIIQAPRSGVRKRQISDEKTLEDSQGSSVNSLGDYNSGSFGSKSGSFEATLDDSGFVSMPLCSDWSRHLSSPPPCSSCSCCPLHPSGLSLNLDDTGRANSSSSLQSGGSLSSLRRRWARSVATTLDLDDFAHPVTSTGKRTKLGIALIIPLSQANPQDMEQYILDRLPLVNNILTRLQHSTERAYCRRDVFVQSMFQATILAVQSMCELVGGPRLDRPLWLTLTSERTNQATKSDLEQQLVNDLSNLLTSLDTKHTNFFISTLLTAVLTHHLGWVPTVMPDMPQHSESLFAELSRNHPYNPLWAQLSDLQGALGYPPKIARTVVVGKSEVVVQQLLSVLSYFIRCGNVKLKDMDREIPVEEENHLEYLLENKQEKRSFDKDAIREFSKAGSLGGTTSSSSTLTKSRTMLSMKTFSVIDCDMDHANSLESGFESCNEFSGGSYEDGNKITKCMQSSGSKLGKSKSSANLMETSFSENTITDCNIISNGKSNETPVSLHSSIITCIESEQKVFQKMESEKQFTSPQVLDVMNRLNSKNSLGHNKSRSNSFIKENLIQSDFTEIEDKQNKVVFVLGESDELVNIKGQDEANIPEDFCCSSPSEKDNEIHIQPPIILVNGIDAEDTNFLEENEAKETDFVTGDVSSRVVIVHSTSIELEDAADPKLKPKQLHRCLSVPEEAVSETEWVKRRRRSREIVQLVRRWLSDSAIERTSHKSLCGLISSESTTSLFKENSISRACVFRTSNRLLKDTIVEPNVYVESFVSVPSCEVPIVKVESTDVDCPVELDEYIELPSQSSVSEGRLREVSVAASVLGSVGASYSPELVLQGLLTVVSPSWLSDLRNTLLLEAHNTDLCDSCDTGEAVCIIANIDTWEVQLVSSHSVRSEPGVRVGMSQLVANLLETTQQLCSLSLSPSVCLSHMETKLQELCVRSQALAELLLSSDSLDIATLTSILDLDASDVPLLLSVASAHTPLVTRKYGLTYQ